jgi:hypothetical protein
MSQPVDTAEQGCHTGGGPVQPISSFKPGDKELALASRSAETVRQRLHAAELRSLFHWILFRHFLFSPRPCK